LSYVGLSPAGGDMADPKMVILRGNSAKAGHYPDEQGNYIAWPKGALHVKAAEEYAKRFKFDPVTLDLPGDPPQSADTRQSKKALEMFHQDDSDIGFYGFSGGGYNLRHILEYLAASEPQSLHRIKRVVVIGAPFKEGEKMFAPSRYIALVADKEKAKSGWQAPDWVPVYKENPKESQMPKGLEKAGTHMFGPDVLLSGWP
jgi:hypothetical protein